MKTATNPANLPLEPQPRKAKRRRTDLVGQHNNNRSGEGCDHADIGNALEFRAALDRFFLSRGMSIERVNFGFHDFRRSE